MIRRSLLSTVPGISRTLNGNQLLLGVCFLGHLLGELSINGPWRLLSGPWIRRGNTGQSPGKKGPRSRKGPPVLTVARDLNVELIKCCRFTASSFTACFSACCVPDET